MKIRVPAIKILREHAPVTGLAELNDIIIKTAVRSDCNKLYWARNCCGAAGMSDDDATTMLMIDDLAYISGLDEFLVFADECYKAADYIFKGATPWIIKFLFNPALSQDQQRVTIHSRRTGDDVTFEWRTELAVYLLKELDNLKYFV